MSYTSAFTGAEIDAGIENAHAAVLRSGSAMTGPLILHDAPTDERGAATKKYVDDAESRAKSHADTKAETTLSDAKAYADEKDATNLDAAKGYADERDDVTLLSARNHCVNRTNAALKNANEYTDSKIPTSLPNPNALTFSGAVNGSYDGSSAIDVEIPAAPSLEGYATESYVNDKVAAIDFPSTDGLATTEYVMNQDATVLLEAKGYASEKGQQVYNEIVYNKIPSQLPNPKALTFSGAVSGSYDGSEALDINIPSGEGNSGSQYFEDALFAYKTFTFMEAFGYEVKITDPLPGSLIVGNEYHVSGSFNNICTAKKIVLDGVVYTAVGNLSLLGVGDNTNEKFVFIAPSADKGAELGWYAKIKANISSTHIGSFTLYGQFEAITRIKEKYMPANYYGEEIVDGYYLTRQTITFDENGEYQITQPLPMSLTVGDSYKIMWNGMYFSCVATKSDTYGFTAVHVGSSSFVFIECPASMAAETGVYAVLRALDSSTEMETSVLGPMHIVKKIDRKYLPGNVGGSAGSYTIVLDESMTGSSEDDTIFYYPDSYDEFAEILYNGGNVWVDMSGTAMAADMPIVRIAISIWMYLESTLVCGISINNTVLTIYCNNGTWTPPTT